MWNIRFKLNGMLKLSLITVLCFENINIRQHTLLFILVITRSTGHTKMDEEKLIIEVQNYPILFDTTHPHYKDTNRKDKAWGEIAEVLGVDGEYLQSYYV